MLSKPTFSRDIFQRNPVFLASLRIPWETSTQADEKLLNFHHEADIFLQNIASLSELYRENNIDHLPQVIPSIKLSTIASPDFREISEILAIIRLLMIKKLLPVHVQVSKIIQKIVLDLYQYKLITNAKVHSIIKENGDFETIIFADPPDNDPYVLTELIADEIEEYLKSDHRQNQLDCPSITVNFIKEENEERAFIEVIIGLSKIIIRDLSSQCYQKGFNPSKPFNERGESSSFPSKLLTDRLLFDVLLSLQIQRGLPQDIYPFIVRYFLKLIPKERLSSLSGLNYLQQIDEEHRLWNEFSSFCQKPQNLIEILKQAQKSLRGCGDLTCIQTDLYGNHSIYEGSEEAEACKTLVNVLCPKSVSEGFQEEDYYAPNADFFLEKAIL